MSAPPFKTRDSAAKRTESCSLLPKKHFDVFITIDKNIRYQQNISRHKIAVLIIRADSNDLDDIRPHVPHALAALETVKPGEIAEVGSAP
jgi:hypothetical protein